MKSRIVLTVEDNVRVSALNKTILEREGYTVLTALNLAEARAILADEPDIDIAVLDILLPDGNGLDFISELREFTRAPVLMLTCKRDYADMVEGLTSGADDYLTKPYRIEELLARMATLQHRHDASHLRAQIARGPLVLDTVAHRAYMNSVDLLLKPREYAVLHYLMIREGDCCSAEQLYETVWNLPMHNSHSAVKTTVSRLRKKLANSGYTISSGHGKGYCFKREE